MKKLFIILMLISYSLSANINEAIKVYYDKNLKKALPMFEKLSKEGNVESNYYLGNMYQYGNGVKQDYKKAFAYYTIASNKDNNKRLRSIFQIAIMYMNAQGVNQDFKKAFDLLYILDKENIGVAQFILGTMYESGEFIPKNQKKAVLYYKKGCNSKKNYPKSCYYAGDHYEQGIGVEQNYSIAKKYYKKACEAGVQESCEAIKKMQEPKSFYDKHKYTIIYNIIIIILLFIAWLRVWRDKKNKSTTSQEKE